MAQFKKQSPERLMEDEIRKQKESELLIQTQSITKPLKVLLNERETLLQRLCDLTAEIKVRRLALKKVRSESGKLSYGRYKQ